MPGTPAIFSFALLVGACGTTSDDTGPEPDPSDTTPPTVVTSTPTVQATGVGADAKIHITFSEPIDRATLEAAYSSPQLPLDKVSMSWNADNTVLTISPDQGLVYAEGTGNDPSTVPAFVYSIELGAGTADLMGNQLGTPFTLTFATKRRLATALPLISSLSRTAIGGTLLGDSTDCWIGDNAVNNTYRSYLTFDLSPLPAGIAIEDAGFAARQLAAEGAPYNMGGVKAQHLTFATMTGVNSVLAMSEPGMFSQDAIAESKYLDVTAQVADDIANRVARLHRSQYRLMIDQTTNSNNQVDKAVFAKATFEMTVVYVAD